MNVQLKEGSVYVDPQNNYPFSAGFGRIRNLTFVIIKGEMIVPETFNGQASVGIAFYNDKAAAISGIQDLYTINLSFSNLELWDFFLSLTATFIQEKLCEMKTMRDENYAR